MIPDDIYKNIHDIATKVRANMVESYCDELLKDCCVECSKELQKELSNIGIVTSRYYGAIELDTPIEEYSEEDGEILEIYEAPHSFLLFNYDNKNYIIDITASQFKDNIHEELEDVYIHDASLSPHVYNEYMEKY